MKNKLVVIGFVVLALVQTPPIQTGWFDGVTQFAKTITGQIAAMSWQKKACAVGVGSTALVYFFYKLGLFRAPKPVEPKVDTKVEPKPVAIKVDTKVEPKPVGSGAESKIKIAVYARKKGLRVIEVKQVPRGKKLSASELEGALKLSYYKEDIILSLVATFEECSPKKNKDIIEILIKNKKKVDTLLWLSTEWDPRVMRAFICNKELFDTIILPDCRGKWLEDSLDRAICACNPDPVIIEKFIGYGAVVKDKMIWDLYNSRSYTRIGSSFTWPDHNKEYEAAFLKIIRLFVAKNKKVMSYCDYDSDNALSMAVDESHMSIVDYLIDQGADIPKSVHPFKDFADLTSRKIVRYKDNGEAEGVAFYGNIYKKFIIRAALAGEIADLNEFEELIGTLSKPYGGGKDKLVKIVQDKSDLYRLVYGTIEDLIYNKFLDIATFKKLVCGNKEFNDFCSKKRSPFEFLCLYKNKLKKRAQEQGGSCTVDGNGNMSIITPGAQALQKLPKAIKPDIKILFNSNPLFLKWKQS